MANEFDYTAPCLGNSYDTVEFITAKTDRHTGFPQISCVTSCLGNSYDTVKFKTAWQEIPKTGRHTRDFPKYGALRSCRKNPSTLYMVEPIL